MEFIWKNLLKVSFFLFKQTDTNFDLFDSICCKKSEILWIHLLDAPWISFSTLLFLIALHS